MVCPWCGKEMQWGELRAGVRTAMQFRPKDAKYGFWENLAGVGALKGASDVWGNTRIPAAYCKDCKKLVLETEL